MSVEEVAGEHSADRLMRAQAISSDVHLHGELPPSPRQVAAVLHALADHTLNADMIRSAPELGADDAGLGPSWSVTTGLGRYFQRMADHLTEGQP